jgi:Ca2+-binding EF-hand superfamily protein
MKTSIFRTTTIVAMLTLGTLTAITAHAGPGADGQKKMQAIDKNGDGKISREEAAAYPRLVKRFDAVDANKDGFVTPQEMKAAHVKATAAKLKAIDANGDGQLSRAEVDAKAPRLAKRFDAIDTNKDGYLSKEELVAARRHNGNK